MTSRGFESGCCTVVFWSWSLWLKKCSNPRTTSPTLPLRSHAVTSRGSTTWLMQVSLTYAWSAVASAFIVVFESVMGVGGHQNAPPTSLSVGSRQLRCSCQREERAGSVFVVVFLQSLFTELLVLIVRSMRAPGEKLHGGAVTSCFWLYISSQWANRRPGRLHEAQ